MSGGTRSGSTPTPPQVSDDSSEVSYHTLVTNHHPFTQLCYYTVTYLFNMKMSAHPLFLTCHKAVIWLCPLEFPNVWVLLFCPSVSHLDQRAQP